MKSNDTKKIKKKDVLESSVIESKRNNKTGIYIIFSFIGLFCAIVCFIVINNRKNKIDSSLEDKVIQYQLIKYNNYNFKMPNEWSFINNSEIKNDKETMHILLSTIDVPFDTFIEEEYQKEFLENYQTDNNVTVNKSGKEQFEDLEYFYMDGFSNSYNYYVVVIGNKDNVVLISAEFIDKITHTNLRQDLIDFALTGDYKGVKE